MNFLIAMIATFVIMASILLLNKGSDDDVKEEGSRNNFFRKHLNNLKEGIDEIERVRTTCKGREYIKPKIKEKISLVRVQDPYPNEPEQLALVMHRGYRKATILFSNGYSTGRSVRNLKLIRNLKQKVDDEYIDRFKMKKAS